MHKKPHCDGFWIHAFVPHIIVEFNVQIEVDRNNLVNRLSRENLIVPCRFDHISSENDAIGFIFHKTKTTQEGVDVYV